LSWSGNGSEYPVDELVGVHALRFGFEAGDDAMAQRVVRDAAHVVRRDEIAAVEPRNGAAALVERDGWYAVQWRYQQIEESLENA